MMQAILSTDDPPQVTRQATERRPVEHVHILDQGGTERRLINLPEPPSDLSFPDLDASGNSQCDQGLARRSVRLEPCIEISWVGCTERTRLSTVVRHERKEPLETQVAICLFTQLTLHSWSHNFTDHSRPVVS